VSVSVPFPLLFSGNWYTALFFPSRQSEARTDHGSPRLGKRLFLRAFPFSWGGEVDPPPFRWLVRTTKSSFDPCIYDCCLPGPFFSPSLPVEERKREPCSFLFSWHCRRRGTDKRRVFSDSPILQSDEASSSSSSFPLQIKVTCLCLLS